MTGFDFDWSNFSETDFKKVVQGENAPVEEWYGGVVEVYSFAEGDEYTVSIGYVNCPRNPHFAIEMQEKKGCRYSYNADIKYASDYQEFCRKVETWVKKELTRPFMMWTA